MNSENIYDAITDVSDKHIIEAKDYKLRKQKPRTVVYRWCAVAASLALAVGIGSFIYANIGGSQSGGTGTGLPAPADGIGGDNSTVFMSYEGPIFPLSVLGDANGISAARNITFDFSDFGRSRESGDGVWLYHHDIAINDSYVLSNNTDSDRLINVIYPFTGTFGELDRLQPDITIGGIALDTGLLAGVYNGGFSAVQGIANELVNFLPIASWEDYVVLLSDGEYLKYALGDVPALDQTVIVYEVFNVEGDHDASINPTLDISFNLDYERTIAMTYRFNGATIDYENGFMRRSFSIPKDFNPEYGRSFYLIIIGDDIENMNTQGYENGGVHDGGEVDHITYDMVRYEATLSDMIDLLFEDFLEIYSDGSDVRTLDMAMLHRAAAELLYSYGILSEKAAFKYETGDLDSIFSGVRNMGRVFYLTAEINIPAESSIALDIRQIKPGSLDFYGSGSGETGFYGYDMLTKLGSVFSFSEMSAALEGGERIEIVNQNFGFNLAEGILSVMLDIEVPHYYLEVRGVALGKAYTN